MWYSTVLITFMAAETMNKHSVIFELMQHYRSTTDSTKNLICNLFFIAPLDVADRGSVDAFYMYDSNDAMIGSYINYTDKNPKMGDINVIQQSKAGGYSLCKSSTGTKVQIHGETYDTASAEDMFHLSTMCNAIEYDLLKIASTISEYHRVLITLYCTEDNIPSTEQLIQDYNSVSDVQFSTKVREHYE